MKEIDLSLEAIQALLSYDPETGIFRWLKSGKGRRRDLVAGVKSHGYTEISIGPAGNRTRIKGHRLAWFFMTGHWPTEAVDHINMDRSDNRFANLREASPAQNLYNRRIRTDSRVGFKGVKRAGNRYAARIQVGGLQHHLGCFASAEEAHQAFCAAAKQLHGDFARAA